MGPARVCLRVQKQRDRVMLGIYTRYQHCEDALVALRLANWAAQAGHVVSLYTPTQTRVALDGHWDKEVTTSHDCRYTDWVVDKTMVIWTRCPISEQIEWANKHNIRTSIFCLWHELHEDHVRSYRAADFVLSPSNISAQFVEQVFKIRQSHALPWDTGEPFTVKDPRLHADYIRVLLPLFDHAPYEVEATALEVAGRALLRFPTMMLTVAYNASKIAPFATRRIKEFKKDFGSRVRLMPGVLIGQRPMLFAAHDLTYWPVCCANTGMIGLTSITMGTPVLAFQIPPLTEFLTTLNSIQVPTTVYSGDMGVPRMEPNYDVMEQHFHAVLADVNRLKLLQQGVLHGLVQRRKAFGEVLTHLIR